MVKLTLNRQFMDEFTVVKNTIQAQLGWTTRLLTFHWGMMAPVILELVAFKLWPRLRNGRVRSQCQICWKGCWNHNQLHLLNANFTLLQNIAHGMLPNWLTSNGKFELNRDFPTKNVGLLAPGGLPFCGQSFAAKLESWKGHSEGVFFEHPKTIWYLASCHSQMNHHEKFMYGE